MFENLREDISRAMRQARPDDWKPTLKHRLEVCVRHSTLPVIAYRFGHWTLGVRIPVIGLLLRIVGLFFRKFVEAIYERAYRCACRDRPWVCDPFGLRDQPGQNEDWKEFHDRHGLLDFSCLPRHRRRRLLWAWSEVGGRRKDWQQCRDRGQQPGAHRCALEHDGDGSSGAHQVARWSSAKVCEEGCSGCCSGEGSGVCTHS